MFKILKEKIRRRIGLNKFSNDSRIEFIIDTSITKSLIIFCNDNRNRLIQGVECE